MIKAAGFDPVMRWFESSLSCHFLEILFIRTFKTAINEFIVMFPSIMSFKIAIDPKQVKAIVPVYQVDAHLTGLWAALMSLLELLLDLSKSLNYFLYSGVA